MKTLFFILLSALAFAQGPPITINQTQVQGGTPGLFLKVNPNRTLGQGTAGGGAPTVPASPVNSIQFNNAGAFGGSDSFLWDDTTKSLTIGGIDAGNLTVQQYATANLAYGLVVDTAPTATGNGASSIGSTIGANGLGAFTYALIQGLDLKVDNDNTAATTSLLGEEIHIQAGTGGGNVTSLISLQLTTDVNDGVVSTIKALFVPGNVLQGGTVTTYYGIHIQDPVLTGGTTAYGLFIDGVSGAATNYAIRTGAGRIVLGDLATTGAASGKKVVCVDTADGTLYASTSDTVCAN